MALTNCADCGREVSDRAAACPGCGAPIGPPPPSQPISAVTVRGGKVRVERAGFRWEAIGVLGVIVGVVALIAGAGAAGAALLAAGFVVFLIGRFIN